MLKLPTDTLRIPINLKSYLKDPLHIAQKKKLWNRENEDYILIESEYYKIVWTSGCFSYLTYM